MKTFTYVLTFFYLLVFGCSEGTQDTQQEPKTKAVKEIAGLKKLSEHWSQDSTIFWIQTVKDSTWQKIHPSDTSSFSNYSMTEIYKLKLQNNLTIKKLIEIDPKLKTKISETDLYTKTLNSNIESRLRITYNYKTQEYTADLLDSIGTNEKKKLNKEKADSFLKTADKEGLYLCGTAYHSILWEDIPLLPIPRKIDKDTALFVIDQWTRK